MDQNCVDAAMTSDEAIKRELEAQMFRCLSPQNSLMCVTTSTLSFEPGFIFWL